MSIKINSRIINEELLTKVKKISHTNFHALATKIYEDEYKKNIYFYTETIKNSELRGGLDEQEENFIVGINSNGDWIKGTYILEWNSYSRRPYIVSDSIDVLSDNTFKSYLMNCSDNIYNAIIGTINNILSKNK